MYSKLASITGSVKGSVWPVVTVSPNWTQGESAGTTILELPSVEEQAPLY